MKSKHYFIGQLTAGIVAVIAAFNDKAGIVFICIIAIAILAALSPSSKDNEPT